MAVPGFANFYRARTPLLGMLPYAGMSFLTHDTVGDWLVPCTCALHHNTEFRHNISASRPKPGSRRTQLTASAELFSEPQLAWFHNHLLYPLEVIRRRMQVSGAVGDGHREESLKPLGRSTSKEVPWLLGWIDYWIPESNTYGGD